MAAAAFVSSSPTPLARFTTLLISKPSATPLSLTSGKGASFSYSYVGSSSRRRWWWRTTFSPAPTLNASPSFSPVMEWQDCSSVIEIDVPCSVAYQCYSDRESIPKWMPFISSVQILKDKPDLSRWTLKYDVFGRDVEFSWLARNMQPIPNQKIHWRSLDGLPNRGAVRFFPRGPSSCRIELTVSYELPQILIPVASAIKPFLEGLLLRGLEQFATVARDYYRKASQL